MTTHSNTHFNNLASSWDKNPFIVQLSAKVCSLFEKHMNKDEDLVLCDFGSGTGLVGTYFLPKTKELLSVDPSENMIQELQKKVQDARLTTVCADLVTDATARKPEWNNHFDYIVSSMVFHHIPASQAAMQVLFGMLKPGGSLLLVDMLKTEQTHLFHKSTVQVDHPHGFAVADLQSMTSAAGFVNFEHEIFVFDKMAEDVNKVLGFELVMIKATKP